MRDEVEKAIQDAGLTAPRVTPDQIEQTIMAEYWFTAYNAVSPDAPKMDELRLLTIAVLVLKNGFTVVGTSACASPENFNAEIGGRLAREDARRQIWKLEGYLLKEGLFRGSPPEDTQSMQEALHE